MSGRDKPCRRRLLKREKTQDEILKHWQSQNLYYAKIKTNPAKYNFFNVFYIATNIPDTPTYSISIFHILLFPTKYFYLKRIKNIFNIYYRFMVKNRDKTKKCRKKALLEKSMMSDFSATNSSITAIRRRCSWVPIQEEITEEDFLSTDSTHANDEEEMINICAQKSTEFLLSGENALRQGMAQPPTVHEILDDAIPEEAFWYSILSAIKSCHHYIDADKLARQLIYSGRIPVMQKRSEVYFILELDVRDMVAQRNIPPDSPVHLNAVYTKGNGNCLCRALSKAFFNIFSRHIELRARIVL